MIAIFDVLVEPNRRRILDLLCTEQRSVNELAEALGLSQPSVSKHLRVLKEAGLVQVRQDAQRRVYSLQAEPLLKLETWLAPYRRKWEETLDALEQHLDAAETTATRSATADIRKGETNEQRK